MSKTSSKKSLMRILLLVVVVAVAGFLVFKYWWSRRSALPEGIASGNGRIEAKLVDVAAKEPLRVKAILVDEGDLVEPDQVVVQMDTNTLEAELAEARANVAAAQERIAVANAAIVRRTSEIELAKLEVERSQKLVQERAGSQREYDMRRTALADDHRLPGRGRSKAGNRETGGRGRTGKRGDRPDPHRRRDAQVPCTRPGAVSPGGSRGSVGCRRQGADPGESRRRVHGDLSPGGRGRENQDWLRSAITLDYARSRAAPGYVSFVSPEAQFTPKQVETRSERSKLMFRVKIQVPPEIVASYIEYIKTGVRGVGYVKVEESAAWPNWLQNLIPGPAQQPESGVATSK